MTPTVILVFAKQTKKSCVSCIECFISFILESEQRTLLLRAPSEQEKSKWIRALEMQIDLVKGGSGEGIISRGERATSGKKSKKDTSLETAIDKNLVILSEIEKIENVRQQNKRSGYEEKSEEKRENFHQASKYVSHSNDVIALGENDISRDSF